LTDQPAINATSPPQPQSIEDLGWRDFFSNQLDDQFSDQGTKLDESSSEAVPARVIAVHRDALIAHDGQQELRIHLGRHWNKTVSVERPTTGDWLLLDPAREWIQQLLDRQTVLKRVSAGMHAGQQVEEQAIAANIDTLFIVTSCNDEFSEPRLERYLAIARNAAIEPVIVVTKSDLSETAEDYRERVTGIADVPVEIVNALDLTTLQGLQRWLSKGKTVAMVGSSGVGKSTLLNTLAGSDIQETGDIRDTDKRGRHTTTHRSVHLLPNGSLMLDTPGIRELTFAFGETVLNKMFEDIEALIPLCRFSDCQHQSEPGCAIKEALETGKLDKPRFENYLKLVEEEAGNTRRLEERHLAKRRFKNQDTEQQTTRSAKKKRKRRI
jgi:ribosome biogenesis GTPase / thiamine phosphate phosphatase